MSQGRDEAACAVPAMPTIPARIPPTSVRTAPTVSRSPLRRRPVTRPFTVNLFRRSLFSRPAPQAPGDLDVGANNANPRASSLGRAAREGRWGRGPECGPRRPFGVAGECHGRSEGWGRETSRGPVRRPFSLGRKLNGRFRAPSFYGRMNRGSTLSDGQECGNKTCAVCLPGCATGPEGILCGPITAGQGACEGRYKGCKTAKGRGPDNLDPRRMCALTIRHGPLLHRRSARPGKRDGA
jgi:hypothetical protein